MFRIGTVARHFFASSANSLRIIPLVGAADRRKFGTSSRKHLGTEKVEGILMAPSRNPESPHQEIAPRRSSRSSAPLRPLFAFSRWLGSWFARCRRKHWQTVTDPLTRS
jgi:hypothetical protein